MKVPCYKDGKDCEKRHPNCHSECPEYQAFWKANREENDKRLLEHTVTSIRLRQKEKLYWERRKLERKRRGKYND